MLHYKIIHEDGTEIFITNESSSGNSKEQLDRFLTNNKKKTYSVFWKDISFHEFQCGNGDFFAIPSESFLVLD